MQGIRSQGYGMRLRGRGLNRLPAVENVIIAALLVLRHAASKYRDTKVLILLKGCTGMPRAKVPSRCKCGAACDSRRGADAHCRTGIKTGRPRKPARCKCGVLCASTVAAVRHCWGKTAG